MLPSYSISSPKRIELTRTKGGPGRTADRKRLGAPVYRKLAGFQAVGRDRLRTGSTFVREKAIRGAEARLTMAGRRAIITLSSTVTNPQRKRFSIAHELGHLEMHRTVSSLSLCTKGDLDDWQSNQSVGNREQEADRFAAALLMPQRFFAQVCRDGDPSLDLVQGLAHQFDTSLTATALRYTEFCDEAIAVAFSQNGFVTWFRRSKEFEAISEF